MLRGQLTTAESRKAEDYFFVYKFPSKIALSLTPKYTGTRKESPGFLKFWISCCYNFHQFRSISNNSCNSCYVQNIYHRLSRWTWTVVCKITNRTGASGSIACTQCRTWARCHEKESAV